MSYILHEFLQIPFAGYVVIHGTIDTHMFGGGGIEKVFSGVW